MKKKKGNGGGMDNNQFLLWFLACLLACLPTMGLSEECIESRLLLEKTRPVIYSTDDGSGQLSWNTSEGWSYQLYAVHPPELEGGDGQQVLLASGLTGGYYSFPLDSAAEDYQLAISRFCAEEDSLIRIPQKELGDFQPGEMGILEEEVSPGGVYRLFGELADANGLPLFDGTVYVDGVQQGRLYNGRVRLELTAETAPHDITVQVAGDDGYVINKTLPVPVSGNAGVVKQLRAVPETNQTSLRFAMPEGYDQVRILRNREGSAPETIYDGAWSGQSSISGAKPGELMTFVIEPYRLESGNRVWGQPLTYHARTGLDDVDGQLDLQGFDGTGKSKLPYDLVSSMNVHSGGSLALGPESIVRVHGKSTRLSVYGKIVAESLSESERIFFTSPKAEPHEGDWGYLYLSEVSNDSLLRYVTIEYAGGYRSVSDFNRTSALEIHDSSPTVAHSHIRHVKNTYDTSDPAYGIWLSGSSSAVIRDSVIEDVTHAGFFSGYSSSLSYSSAGDYRFENNQVLNSGSSGWVYYHSSGHAPVIAGNTFSSNGGKNALRVQGSIGSDIRWDMDVRFNEYFSVVNGGHLTIDPGVTIYGGDQYARLHVRGKLTADGGSESGRIRFTSIKDEPQAGDWGYIYLGSSNNDDHLLRYVTIEYAGGYRGVGGSNRTSALEIHDSSPTVAHSHIRHVKNTYDTSDPAYGIWLRGSSSAVIRDSVIEDVTHAGFFSGYTSSPYYSSVGDYHFENNQVLNSGSAAWVYYYGTGHAPVIAGNTFSGNGGKDALRVQGMIGEDTRWDTDVRFHEYFYVVSGAHLTIDPGVTVYGGSKNAYLYVRGKLTADGGSESGRIRFTSINDEPQAGDWGFVCLSGSGSNDSLLRYVTIEYAGGHRSVSASSRTSALEIYNSSPTVAHAHIRHVKNTYDTSDPAFGLLLWSSSPIIRDSIIEDVANWGVYNDHAIPQTITNTLIRNNGGGIYSRYSGGTIDARSVNWGHISGPYHPTKNPDGQANRISNHVLFAYGTADAPAFSLEAGTYTSPQTLTLIEPSGEGEIRYTLDGSRPDHSSPLYSEPFSIGMDELLDIRARVYRNQWLPSEVVHREIHVEDPSSLLKVNGPLHDPVVGQTIEYLDFAFNKQLHLPSVTADQLRLGGSPALASAERLGTLTYRFHLSEPVTEDGTHVYTVGPDLLAEAGNAFDQNGDGQPGQSDDVFTGQISLKTTPPPAPQVADLQVGGAPNITTVSQVTLSGTAELNSEILINNLSPVTTTDGTWQTVLSLEEGDNSFILQARDQAGNLSPNVTVTLLLDTVAPQVVDSFQGVWSLVPERLTMRVTEIGSGIDLAASSWRVLRNGVEIPGELSLMEGTTVVFTPSVVFPQGNYTIAAVIQDRAGNRSALHTSEFVLDTDAPPAPVVDEVPSVVTHQDLTVQGSKEAHAAIVFGENGDEVGENTEVTTWQWPVVLEPGINELVFRARDRAGNLSEAARVSVRFDNQSPGPVTPEINPQGDGREISLDWSNYDIEVNGNDIALFHVYTAASSFSSITDSHVQHQATLDRFQKTYQVTGLNRHLPVFVAVLAEDELGLRDEAVTSVAVTPEDIIAPAFPANLQVVPSDNTLALSWPPVPDNDEDLAGYEITINGEVRETVTEAVYEVTGLTPATSSPIQVRAVDVDGNRSSPMTDPGVTLLANPQPVETEALSGKARLTWQASNPANLVAAYHLYVSNQAFSSVEGMDPAVSVSTSMLNAVVSGLENGVEYHLAVAAENLSGGIAPAVTSLPVTPEEDTEGPELSALKYGTEPLVDGMALTTSRNITLTATDQSGVANVAFTLTGATDSVQLGTDHSVPYVQAVDLSTVADGDYALTVVAHDSVGNSTTQTINVTVALDAPGMPAMQFPANNSVVGDTEITANGTAISGAEVVLSVDGAEQTTTEVDSQGRWRGDLVLPEGESVISAEARFVGRSALSSPRNHAVTVDITVPKSPTALTATAKAGRLVVLEWKPPVDAVAGYHVYRSDTPFESITSAVRLTETAFSGVRFEDIPPEDGEYFYRVVSLNVAGTPSEPSALAGAVVDGAAPVLESLSLSSSGPSLDEPLTIARGTLTVQATWSEPLLKTPYLAIAPQDGVPLVVSLVKIANQENTYSGSVEITEHTPPGTARVVMSAIDRVANHGSAVAENASFQIDSQGPQVTALELLPASPIDNNPDASGALKEVLVMVEADQPSTSMPVLVPLLDGVALEGYEDGLSLLDETTTGGAPRWSGSFLLPADAGLSDAGEAIAEPLTFSWSAVDALENPANTTVQRNFQVYQGDLPPLDVPTNLTGEAGPGGVITLQWDAVADADGYRLYRQAMDTQQELEAIQDIDGEEASFVDNGELGYGNAAGTGLQDGDYQYTVASLRQANGETAASGQANPVTVSADSVRPGTPQNLTATLGSSGVQLAWTHVEVGARYHVYRQPEEVLDSSLWESLPTLEEEGIEEPAFLDKAPTSEARYYYVIAEDPSGNLSEPAGPAYLNATLLPVRELVATLEHNGVVDLQWQYDLANAQGFNVHAGSRADSLALLNGDGLVAGPSNPVAYRDEDIVLNAQGFMARDRLYQVEAIDDQGEASLARELLMPAVSVKLAEQDDEGDPLQQSLKVGVFNRLLMTVHNHGDTELENVQVQVAFEQYENEQWVTREYRSEAVSLAPGANRQVPVIIGGINNPSAASAEITTTLTHTQEGGEQVRIRRKDVLPVQDASYMADLRVETLIANAEGQVRLYLENTTDLPVDVVLAEGNGNRPSPDVRIFVQDGEGNTLSQTPVQLFTGPGVVTKANGRTIASIQPGESFLSEPVTLNTAQAPEGEVNLKLVIDRLYYDYGGPSQASTAGLQVNRRASTETAPYQGEVLGITPQDVNLFGVHSRDVTITGRALAAGVPQANAPLDLVLSVKGYERVFPVVSDANGDFSHIFRPTVSDAGVYTVNAVYPGSKERLSDNHFEVRGVSLTPQRIAATWPKNYPNSFVVKVKSHSTTALENLTIEVPSSLPEGISITPPPAVTLSPGAQAALEIGFSGTPQAESQNVIELPVVFGDGSQTAGTIYLDYTLVEAKPALGLKPAFVETGLAQGERLSEDLTLTNNGFETALGVKATLAMEDGSAVPTWARLVQGSGPVDLAPNQSLPITLSFSPDSGVLDGSYLFDLTLEADNVSPQTHPVYVAVVQEGEGDALFHISDIYTATTDEQGNAVLGLEGAKVKIQNANVLEQTYTLTTNADGYVTFEGVPPGRYYYHVSASGHESKSGSFWIRPGITVSEDVFLMNQLVTVSWGVDEISVTDEYHVTLTATYQTDVPAPVIALEPKTVKLPMLMEGETFYGELRMTNLGLIRGYNVYQDLPRPNDWYRVEFLREPPDVMEPGQVAILPYRVTADRRFDGIAAADTGGACTGAPGSSTTVGCNGECPNGEEVSVADSTTFSPPSTSQDCAISNTGTIIGGGGNYGGGWGGGAGGWGGGASPIGGSEGGCGDDDDDECPNQSGGG